MLGSEATDPVAACAIDAPLGPNSKAVDKMAMADGAVKIDENFMTLPQIRNGNIVPTRACYHEARIGLAMFKKISANHSPPAGGRDSGRYRAKQTSATIWEYAPNPLPMLPRRTSSPRRHGLHVRREIRYLLHLPDLNDLAVRGGAAFRPGDRLLTRGNKRVVRRIHLAMSSQWPACAGALPVRATRASTLRRNPPSKRSA